MCLYFFLLNRIPKETRRIPFLPLQPLLVLTILLRPLELPIPPRILPPQIQRHHSRQNRRHRQHANQNRMSRNISRTVFLQIDEPRDRATKVAETDVHRDPDAAFHAAADVVSVPRDALRHVGVDAGGEEEAAGVFDVVFLLAGCRDEHDEPDYRDDVEADHEEAAGAEAVGGPAACDAAEAGDDVWRDGH